MRRSAMPCSAQRFASSITGRSSNRMRAPSFEPRQISSRWPARPKPVTSVMRVHGRQLGERVARRVELRRRREHRRVAASERLPFLSAADRMPTPSGLPRISASPGRARAVSLHLVRMHQPERDQAVDRLERIDRMAAGDRDAGLRAHRLAALAAIRWITSTGSFSSGMPTSASAKIGRRPSRRCRRSRWSRRCGRSRTGHRRSA